MKKTPGHTFIPVDRFEQDVALVESAHLPIEKQISGELRLDIYKLIEDKVFLKRGCIPCFKGCISTTSSLIINGGAIC